MLRRVMAWIEERNGDLILRLRIVPRAARDRIVGLVGEALKVRIQAPPVEGKANAYLIRYLAGEWGLPRRSMELLSGATGRDKRLRIVAPPPDLRAKLRRIAESA